MNLIKTEEAVGHVLCHDMTQIIKGVTNDARFRKGHIVTEEDIPVLLSMGKENLYVWEKNENMLHEDEAAEILRGRKVAPDVRCIVIPGTQDIYMQMLKEGLVMDFIEAGAVVSTPTCGPCLGGYMGILAPHERCVSTTNRNFVGRMGDTTSEIYLASPAVAATSAVTGKISGPADLGL